jgi:hypothetical protein
MTQNGRDLGQNLVTSEVAPGVIDPFEMIEVEDKEGDIGAVPVGPRNLLEQISIHLAPIVEPGEWIMRGQLGQPCLARPELTIDARQFGECIA